MKQLEADDSGVQFSHTIEEQIGGQLKAGLMLTCFRHSEMLALELAS